jgi:hypothetical protein
MTMTQVEHSKFHEDPFYDDIELNWLTANIGLKYHDAADLKEAGFTIKDVKLWVKEFETIVGSGYDFMDFIFDYEPEAAARYCI